MDAMTEEMLAAIEARVNAIPSGNWTVQETRIGNSWYRAEVSDANIFHRLAEAFDPKDADFIAHAPSDVKALLAEVRRLRGELAKYTEPM